MQLRENAGGDKDLFSVERKLKRLKKRQEKQNEKAYEREKNKTDVFNFLNKTLSGNNSSKCEKQNYRRDIRSETSRNLNVASLQIEENIKKYEVEIIKIKQSLTRHSDSNSQMHKSLKNKLFNKQEELQVLKHKAVNIKNEQNLRKDNKKFTIF